MASGRLSLAQQIAQLEEAAPVDYDPEDTQMMPDREMEDGMGPDPAAREHYVDVGPSTLRKLHHSIADPKYEGVRMTRKQLMEDSGGEHSEDEEDQDIGYEGLNEGTHSRDAEDDEELDEEGDGSDQGPSESGEEESEEDDEQPEPRSAAPQPKAEKPPTDDADATEDMSSTLRKTREEERKKGKAVSRQLALWDTLLDARIRMQKSVAAVNNLPLPFEIEKYMEVPECRDSVAKLMEESLSLVDELFEFQENLMTANEIITPPPRKRRKLEPYDKPAEYTPELVEATEAAAALEQSFHPYMLQTLSKWSSKIQAVAPSVLLPSNRGAFSKGSQNVKSAVQLIDEALSDRGKSLAKTQVRKSKGMRIGMTEETLDDENKEDPELFDDTDFYQKMLRDIIDARSGNAAQEDWMVLQKQKKAKKKVDTKASKGRKLRYEVHEKLQNFMVPVPMAGAWHDEQIDELFSSLLGKGFENATADEPAEAEAAIDLGDALKGGFRVFG